MRFIKLLHGCTASERFSSDHDKLLTPSLKSLAPPFRQTLSRNKPNHSASAAAHDCNVHIWLLVVNMQWTLLTLVHHESCTGALKASTLGLNGLIEAFYLHFLSDLNKHDESVFLQMSRQRRTDGKQARERERELCSNSLTSDSSNLPAIYRFTWQYQIFSVRSVTQYFGLQDSLRCD